VVLVVLVLVGVAFFGGGQPQAVAPGTLSRTTSLVLVAAFVALIGGIVVAVAVTHAHKAERRRAEEARDLAAERAQLLAAAMDPEVAMRLLGYDGRRGPDNG
jgi:cell division protease FtsH